MQWALKDTCHADEEGRIFQPRIGPYKVYLLQVESILAQSNKIIEQELLRQKAQLDQVTEWIQALDQVDDELIQQSDLYKRLQTLKGDGTQYIATETVVALRDDFNAKE